MPSQHTDQSNPSPVPLTPTAIPSGKRVLVVDDHQDLAETLWRVLRALGYDVRAVSDPLEALTMASEFRPHIALVDLGLPTMDGYSLAAELRARLGGDMPKLIALTAFGQAHDRQRILDAGFALHLVKPIDFDELLLVLDKLAVSS